jgi:hypothetical protein
MKPTIRFPALLCAAWSLGASTASATTFSQFFNNGPTGTTPHQDKNANTWSWQAAYGSAATIDGTLSNSDGYLTGVSQGGGVSGFSGSTANGFLFAVPSSGAAGVSLIHTTSTSTSDVVQNTPIQPANNTAPNSIQWYRDLPQGLAGLTVNEITQLAASTRPESTSSVMRFALRVDGVWHVSESSWQNTSNAAWERQTLAPASVQWRSGVFSSGFLDDDLSDNNLATLPTDGIVSGYGLYAATGALEGSQSRIRIDAFQVTTDFSDPYLLWARGPFANAFGETGLLEDPDRDGIDNLMEFVLGGDPTIFDQPSIGPEIISADGDDLVIRFRRSDLSEARPTAVVVQIGTELVTWNPADEIVIGPSSGTGPNGSSYLVDDSGTLDVITVTIPKNGANHLFARIVAR